MRLKDYAIDGFVQATKKGSFNYEIYIHIDERLNVPEDVKEKYGYGNTIMLSIKNTNSPALEYNFERRELSWLSSFNKTPWTVVVPMNNILAIFDRENDEAISYGATKIHASATRVQPNDFKFTKQIKHLKLVDLS